jgi:hypothetical protein
VIKCIACKSQRFYYEKTATLAYCVASIDKDGGVDTTNLVKTHHHDDDQLTCYDCGLEMSVQEYIDAQERMVANDR